MSMKEFKALLPTATRQALNYLKLSCSVSGGFLLAIFLGSFMLNALAQSMMTGVMDTTYFIAICIMALTDMLVSFFFLIVLPVRLIELRQGRPIQGIGMLTKAYGGDLAAEMLRVASGMVFGLLMGIIPGILRSLRWVFVPFVVTADQKYAQGDRDALMQSASLAQGLLLGIASLWLIFFFLDMGLYQLDQVWWNLQKADSILAWGGSLLINFISTACAIYSTLLYFAIYEIRFKAQGDQK